MKKIGGINFILGVLVGAAMFGGSVAAAATGIIAQPKTAAVVIDGQAVDLKGFIIRGNHYFQLRDLDEKLIPSGKDFSIVWDGTGNRVIIDTSRNYDPNEQYAASVTTSPSQAPAVTIDEMRDEIIKLSNAERIKAGLPELAALPALMDSAQAKAQDFKDSKYYGHTSPVYGTFSSMIRSFVPEAKAVGENIAACSKTPSDAFTAWTESPPHYDNILGQKFSHIGVGVIEGVNGGYWFSVQFAQIT